VSFINFIKYKKLIFKIENKKLLVYYFNKYSHCNIENKKLLIYYLNRYSYSSILDLLPSLYSNSSLWRFNILCLLYHNYITFYLYLFRSHKFSNMSFNISISLIMFVSIFLTILYNHQHILLYWTYNTFLQYMFQFYNFIKKKFYISLLLLDISIWLSNNYNSNLLIYIINQTPFLQKTQILKFQLLNIFKILFYNPNYL
jgi:hypothetical protein